MSSVALHQASCVHLGVVEQQEVPLFHLTPERWLRSPWQKIRKKCEKMPGQRN